MKSTDAMTITHQSNQQLNSNREKPRFGGPAGIQHEVWGDV